MYVLVACEFSGVVRDAFRVRGHAAFSVDLLPCEGDSRFHWQGNVNAVLNRQWDLMIAHPPCTYLCNSGVRWLVNNSQRWRQLEQAAGFFRLLLQSDIPRIAIENPIMHKHALALIGRKHDQIIQPWQFGHGETKATCLWLKGLPALVPTCVVSGREARVHRMAPSVDRWRERSRTYAGIARAMAKQWG